MVDHHTRLWLKNASRLMPDLKRQFEAIGINVDEAPSYLGRAGAKVLVEIIDWESKNLEGKIIKNILISSKIFWIPFFIFYRNFKCYHISSRVGITEMGFSKDYLCRFT